MCGRCLSRRSQKAARAGTPGFRPPEVLLKSEHQTTAVDMWAAGVVLLCMLSRTYPFFRAPDDVSALAEVACLAGTDAVREAACQYGKRFLCSEHRAPVDLQELCRRLAARPAGMPRQCRESPQQDLATDDAVDLLTKLTR